LAIVTHTNTHVPCAIEASSDQHEQPAAKKTMPVKTTGIKLLKPNELPSDPTIKSTVPQQERL